MQEYAEGAANQNIIKSVLVDDIRKRSFLWTKHDLYVMHDYILVDLEKEFEYRITDGNYFSEAEIKVIMRGTASRM